MYRRVSVFIDFIECYTATIPYYVLILYTPFKIMN